MFYDGYDCELEIGRYSNNRIALQLIDVTDGEPVTIASINVPEVEIAEDEVIIKNYSENTNIELFLIKNKIVTERTRMIKAGFVMVPVYKLNMDLILELEEKQQKERGC